MPLPLTLGGAVRIDTSGAIAGHENAAGLPVTAAGDVAASIAGAHAFTHNGLSFTADGRVRFATAGPVAEIHNDLPLDATGAVVGATADPGEATIHSGRRRGASGLFVDGLSAALPVTSGLAAHFRADTLELNDAGGVALWHDTSGHNRHLSAVVYNQPSYEVNEINGRPVLRFNGGTAALIATLDQPLATDDFAAFVVARRSVTPGANGRLLSFGASGQLVDFDNPAAGVALFDAGTSYATYYNLAQRAAGPAHAAGANVLEVNAAAGVAPVVRQNGTAGPAGSATTWALQINRLVIGSRPDLADFYAGDIAEVVLYDRALTAGEATQVRNYLAARFAITVA